MESKNDRKLEKALFYADSDDLGYKCGRFGVKHIFENPQMPLFIAFQGFSCLNFS